MEYIFERLRHVTLAEIPYTQNKPSKKLFWQFKYTSETILAQDAAMHPKGDFLIKDFDFTNK